MDKHLEANSIKIEDSVHKAYKKWQTSILKASKAAIPRGCRKEIKPWWNKDLDNLVLLRNDARKKAHLGEEEKQIWLRTENELKNSIFEAKKERWRNFVTGLSFKTNASTVWNTIKGLDGRTPNSKPNKALKRGNKDPEMVSSYRRITLTSCVAKLVERLVKERLEWWLEHKNLLITDQK